MVSFISQNSRLLQLSTPLGESILALISFNGIEALSMPFQFKLHMISDNTAITAEQVIKKPFQVMVNHTATSSRYFHGLISDFSAGMINQGVRHYFATMVPDIAFLDSVVDSRIFQNQSALTIIKQILQKYNCQFDFSNISSPLKKREYCVQYQESALRFIQRLLAEEGLSYYYNFSADKHVLTVIEKIATAKMISSSPIIYGAGTNEGQQLSAWSLRSQFYPGVYTQQDYNYQSPSESLLTKQDNAAKLTVAKQYEVFNYPGQYQTIDDGKKLSQQYFANNETSYAVAQGAGNCVNFIAGNKFTLQNQQNPADNNDYVLTEIVHNAVDGTYLHGQGGSQSYTNSFSCIPINANYSPPRFSKPLIIGCQTAIVVGPERSETYVDNYARVKVQFHWDRYNNYNDESSCFIRVAQLWAGNQWGSLFMPRVGQEVIVHFLDGDPDRPIICGSVYNGNHTVPYDLPAQMRVSGIKSNSTKNGAPNQANELRFDDTLGSEELYIHAQKNLNQVIENDNTITVNQGDLQIAVQQGQAIISAQQSIQFTVSDNTILINTQGITINGQQVNISP